MTYASSRTLSIGEPGLIKVCLPHHSLWLNKSDTLTKSLWPFHCFSIMDAILSISECFCSQGIKVENGQKILLMSAHTAPTQIGFTFMATLNIFSSLDHILVIANTTNQQTWSANVLVRNVNSSIWRMKDWKDRHLMFKSAQLDLFHVCCVASDWQL